MVDLDQFLQRCDAVANAANIRLSTLSTRLFNDGGRLKDIVNGSDVGARRLKRASADLDRIERDLTAARTARSA